MKLIAVLVTLMFTQVCSAQTYYLLTGTYTNGGKSKGIYVYSFDSKTSNTKFISSTYSENPAYLIVSKNNKYVYAVNENGDNKGSVSSFSFDPQTGNLKFINKQPTLGDAPCHVSIDPHNKWLITANYTGGNFSVFPIKEDGTLGSAVQTIQHSGSSINKERQEKAHAHSVVFSNDGHFLAVTDLGTDKIYLYPFNSDNKKPVTEKAFEIKSNPGSGPRHLIFNPAKPFAYVIEELSGNVAAYKYNNGKLELLQVIKAHPENYKGENGGAAIRLSADGNFLYITNRGGSNTIGIFSIDNQAGKLTSKGFQSTGGIHPRDFAIDPSGNFLLVANTQSDYVSIFSRNPKTGLISNSGRKITLPEPTNLVFTHIK